MRVTSVLRGLFLAIAVSAIAVGCGDDDDKKKAGDSDKSKAGDSDKAKAGAESGSGAAAEASSAPSAVIAAAPSAAKGGGELLAYIPGDANAVFGLNLGGIVGSPLYKMMWPMIAQKAGANLKEFTDACGDPMSVLHSMVLGGNTQKDQGAVAFKVGISKDKAKQCATTMAAKKGEKISFEESGKLIALKKKDGDTKWLAWLDGGIILAVPDKGGDKGALEALVANKTPVTGNGPVMKLVGEVDRNATFWGVFLAPADEPLKTIPGAAAAKAVFGSISLSNGIKLDAVMRFASADQAKATAAQVNGMMGQFKAHPELGKFIAKVAVVAAGSDLTVKLDLSIAELGELMQKAQQQLPMIMKMMGNK